MLIFQLADRMGITVSRLMEEMTVDEFIGWMVFHKMKGKR